MPTNVIQNSKIGDIQLGVATSGLVVTVSPGAFKVMQGTVMTDFTLGEEYTYTVEPEANEDMTAVGFLAVRESDGEVVLVTDEMRESDEGLFNWRGSGFRILHGLFTVHVPAGATEIDPANLVITHHTPPEEQEE